MSYAPSGPAASASGARQVVGEGHGRVGAELSRPGQPVRVPTEGDHAGRAERACRLDGEQAGRPGRADHQDGPALRAQPAQRDPRRRGGVDQGGSRRVGQALGNLHRHALGHRGPLGEHPVGGLDADGVDPPTVWQPHHPIEAGDERRLRRGAVVPTGGDGPDDDVHRRGEHLRLDAARRHHRFGELVVARRLVGVVDDGCVDGSALLVGSRGSGARRPRPVVSPAER